MNPVDVGVLGAVFVCAVIVLARGFVRTVLALVSWVGASLATLHGFAYVRPYAHQWIDKGPIGDIAAGVAVFVAALIVFSVVSHVLSGFIRRSPLNFLDRSLGFAFGIGLGVVLVALFWLAASGFFPKDKRPDFLEGSRALPFIEIVADGLRRLLPFDIGDARKKADDAADAARQSDILRRAVGGANQPAAPRNPDAAEKGYRQDERRGIDRLIETRSGNEGANR
jgi:membrane protein required for colicin V production